MSVLSAVMLVSLITLSPVIEGRPIDRITNRMEKFNKKLLGNDLYTSFRENITDSFPLIQRKLYDKPLPEFDSFVEKLKAFNINILGQENYTEIRELIVDHFRITQNKINTTNMLEDWLDAMFEIVVEWCVSIFAVSYFLFGHNWFGDTLALAICCILLPIPITILSAFESLLYIPLCVTLMLFGVSIDFEQILYDYGVIGLVIILTIILPLSIMCGTVLFPIILVLITWRTYWDLIDYITKNISDW
jgi:hypothetical protein